MQLIHKPIYQLVSTSMFSVHLSKFMQLNLNYQRLSSPRFKRCPHQTRTKLYSLYFNVLSWFIVFQSIMMNRNKNHQPIYRLYDVEQVQFSNKNDRAAAFMWSNSIQKWPALANFMTDLSKFMSNLCSYAQKWPCASW